MPITGAHRHRDVPKTGRTPMFGRDSHVPLSTSKTSLRAFANPLSLSFLPSPHAHFPPFSRRCMLAQSQVSALIEQPFLMSARTSDEIGIFPAEREAHARHGSAGSSSPDAGTMAAKAQSTGKRQSIPGRRNLKRKRQSSIRRRPSTTTRFSGGGFASSACSSSF